MKILRSNQKEMYGLEILTKMKNALWRLIRMDPADKIVSELDKI